MGAILIFFANLLHGAISLLQLMILVQVVLSWMAVGLPLNPITRLMYSILETLYRPIRSVVPTALGGVDFTPGKEDKGDRRAQRHVRREYALSKGRRRTVPPTAFQRHLAPHRRLTTLTAARHLLTPYLPRGERKQKEERH